MDQFHYGGLVAYSNVQVNGHLDSPEVSNPLLNNAPISLHITHTPCSADAPVHLNHLTGSPGQSTSSDDPEQTE